jgi:alkylation response protein AidB-like acyl-CoA dehydrogenase
MREGLDLKWSATWSTRASDVEYEFRRNLARKLGARGWLFPTFPTESGGAGLTADHHWVLATELDRYGIDLSTPFYTLASLAAPCILAWGTEDQKRAFLPGLVKAEVSTWQLLTEPQGGSDVANCRTVARRDGDQYVINGQKIMVGSSHRSEYLWTLVCTDPGGKRHENLSWIYIPTDTPGITIIPLPMLMGIKNSVFFDDLRVPAFNLIGGENNGWQVGATHLELEHGGAGWIGGDLLTERLAEYCQQHQRGGKPLIADPKVRELLADVLIESHTAGLFAMRNFWHRFTRQPHPYGGAQHLYYSRMSRLRNARRMQQILGYLALVPNLDVHEAADFEHLARRGPGELHGAGTLDTDRLIIARRLGIGRSDVERAPTTV